MSRPRPRFSPRSVPLTTVAQPRHRLGRTAVELLLAQIGGAAARDRHVVFEPQLVVRASTRLRGSPP